jgi:hypothetical protein
MKVRRQVTIAIHLYDSAVERNVQVYRLSKIMSDKAHDSVGTGI